MAVVGYQGMENVQEEGQVKGVLVVLEEWVVLGETGVSVPLGCSRRLGV